MERIVRPELLDELPPDDPAARANRADLRHLNGLAGNHRWFSRQLARFPLQPALELGAGDGFLGACLYRRFAAREGAGSFSILGIDRMARPPAWPAAWPWWRGELEHYEAYEARPAVFANWILHQLEDDALARLGAHWNASAQLLLCSETRRSAVARRLVRLGLALLRMHPVTRHDAIVSLEAGFRGEELPRLLGLDPARWQWTVSENILGAYRLVAWKEGTAR